MGDHLRVLEYVACQCELFHSKLIENSDSMLLRYEEHTIHACENRLCPITCQLCKRLCNGDHLHGLSLGENHLCGYAHCFLPFTMIFTWASRQEHSCSALCSDAGICQIDTTPQSIEATFTGRHETFQYTKVSAMPISKAALIINEGLVYSGCVISQVLLPS